MTSLKIWPWGLALSMMVCAAPQAQASTCYGTTSNGRIESAVALPASGANFAAYSKLGVVLGRTYVHAKVSDVVLGAWTALARDMPGTTFIYGETGLEHGGPFPPHRTHESGTSVDFMVPVRTRDGRPAVLPGSALNRFGYDLEFDSDGRLDDLQIDFAAIAAHLFHLDREARRHGIGIARVIFDPALSSRLFAAPGGARIKTLPFMKTKPWIRHDEHYHVDFAVRCEPLQREKR